MSRPCVFLDRDGIVNRPPTLDRYVRRWEEFELLPEFLDVLRLVSKRGYEAVVVTNQKGIATGHMSQEDVDLIHRNLRSLVEQNGLKLLDIVVCPSADDKHPHRKPNPGMLIDTARRHDLDLARSWMVGDHESDVEAGRRAGCKTVLVAPTDRPTAANFRVANVSELIALLEAEM
jgi:D-glycero-D-manno-heptose 1,7-bisphosphate phosphatase